MIDSSFTHPPTAPTCVSKNLSPIKVKFNRAALLAKVISQGLSKIHQDRDCPIMLCKDYFAEVKQQPNGVRYLKPNERFKWAIRIKDGRLFKDCCFYNTTANKLFPQPPADALVIGPDKRFYGGAIQKNKFHHSSFLAGGAVLFAGEIETNPLGKLIKITNRSGHYKPQKEHLLFALKELKKWEVDLSRVVLWEYSSVKPNRVRVHASAEHYLLSKGQCLPQETIECLGAINDGNITSRCPGTIR